MPSKTSNVQAPVRKEEPNEFSQACGNLSVRYSPKNHSKLGPGYRLPLVGPGPSQRTRRKDRALLIVRDEFPGWLFLGGLLSSRAHLRFTNRPQYALGDFCWQRIASKW